MSPGKTGGSPAGPTPRATPRGGGLLAGWLAATGRGPRRPEHVSLLACWAIMLLIGADVIRPSLGWVLAPATPAGWSRRWPGSAIRRIRRTGAAGRPRLQPDDEAGAAPDRGDPRRQGRPGREITVGDCLELPQVAGDGAQQRRHQPGVLPTAARHGHLRCPKPPRARAHHEGPARPGAADRPVRHRGPPGPRSAGGLPAGTPARCRPPHLAQSPAALGGLFWRDLELHHPGIDSLHLPADAAAAWKQRITTKTTRTRQPAATSPRPTPGSTTATTSSRSAPSTSTWPSGQLTIRPGGGRGRRPARSGTTTSPSAARSDPAASRGWTSAPANGSRSFRRCWPRWTPPAGSR